MARRRRGRAIDGWLILDKPAGVSSAAAVARARRALAARKAGHAGTLDPAATGLLAIAFGEATKTVPWVVDANKCYRFTVRWGAATATDDAGGEIVATAAHRPGEVEIRAALPRFTGDILQVPPQVSAVKVDGQRAYARARAGEALDLAARPLHVARLELVEVADRDTAVLEMVCGKGGYVRSLARDIGEALGCLGHVVTLRRLWSGPFGLDGALDWAALEDDGDALSARLLPLEAALAGLREVACAAGLAAQVGHGNPVALAAPDGPAWAGCDGRALALGQVRAGVFHPERVFVREAE